MTARMMSFLCDIMVPFQKVLLCVCVCVSACVCILLVSSEVFVV